MLFCILLNDISNVCFNDAENAWLSRLGITNLGKRNNQLKKMPEYINSPLCKLSPGHIVYMHGGALCK